MQKKILVIEDERDIAELVKLVLESESFLVETILDPMLAVETAKCYRPDLILLDLTMPKMDGWEIFKILRQDPDFKNIPIAILTAKSEEFDTIVGLHVMKVDAYITKPFGRNELIKKVNELVNRKQK